MTAPRTDTRRLDELLVDRRIFPTRSRARDAILRGTVKVEGVTATKAGQSVSEKAEVAVSDPASRYVSRAALKLIAGLDHFRLDPRNAIALDIGASSGGFAQVLLERAGAHVICVDVGHGQMDPILKADPRVTNLEGVNARALTRETIGGHAPDFLVSDVSFISLKLALPPALDLAAPGATGLFLVKPQFEAGRDAIGKGGILKDASVGSRIAEELRDWLGGFPGWHAIGLLPSPIEGGDGNREYLIAGRKDR